MLRSQRGLEVASGHVHRHALLRAGFHLVECSGFVAGLCSAIYFVRFSRIIEVLVSGSHSFQDEVAGFREFCECVRVGRRVSRRDGTSFRGFLNGRSVMLA